MQVHKLTKAALLAVQAHEAASSKDLVLMGIHIRQMLEADMLHHNSTAADLHFSALYDNDSRQTKNAARSQLLKTFFQACQHSKPSFRRASTQNLLSGMPALKTFFQACQHSKPSFKHASTWTQ